jgi:hypothetical protein
MRPDVPIIMITAYGDAETKCSSPSADHFLYRRARHRRCDPLVTIGAHTESWQVRGSASVAVATAMTVDLTWPTGLSRLLYFDETAGMNVIDVAVDRNMLYHQRMLANTAHVMNDTRRLIPNSMPFYKFARA